MYWDKDSRGLFSILELTAEEFETIRRALLAYRTIMVTANAIDNESNRQQRRSTRMLHKLSDTK